MTVVSKSPESLHSECWPKSQPRQSDHSMYLTQSMEDDAPELEKEYAKAPALPCCRRCAVPVTYEIDKQRRLVIATLSDPVTAAEALASQEKLVQDPDFDPSFSQIVDCTRYTAAGMEARDVHRLAQRNVFSVESRRAFVIPGNLAFGFGRMFEMLRENAGENGIRVCRKLDEAVDWVLSKSLTD